MRESIHPFPKAPGFQGAVASLLLLIGVAGCSSVSDRSPAPAGGADAHDQREVLMRTDRDFSAASGRLGASEAFAMYAAPDAVMLPAAGGPVRGRDAIRRHMQTSDGLDLSWAPSEATVSRSGDLGYTWGFFEAKPRGATAAAGSARKGKYVSIWRKQPGGSWKWVMDVGNLEP